MPDNIETWNLTGDQKYLLDIARCISNGQCDVDLANRKPGPIHEARWLNKASRILRVYIATENPSDNLRLLALYVMKVYIPIWFQIKSKPTWINGSKHLYNIIRLSRFMPENCFSIITNVIKNNAYYAHTENLIMAMICDERLDIRKEGYRKILLARETEEDVCGPRNYDMPLIDFTCTDYVNIIPWIKSNIFEPPFTRNYSQEEIIDLLNSDEEIIAVPDFPCHSQGTERTVQAVSQTAHFVTEKHREGVIRSTIESRKKRPHFETKKDFK